MNVCVLGLGYVGTVTAACLARHGHDVIGVDINQQKVDLINNGNSPVIEPGLAGIIERMVTADKLRATVDAIQAIAQSELILVCVGTPSDQQGGLHLDQVQQVCEQIGTTLATADTYKAVVIRSTLLPDAFSNVVVETLTIASSKQPGIDFGVVANPEFIREGSAVADFETPPFTIIGTTDPRAGNLVANLYAGVDAPTYPTTPEAACMVKYASNAFHALKVTFANEIGRLCNALDVDGNHVMDIFCQDTRLNISPRYLRPGFAFGGSCLPKDLRALTYVARHHDVRVPVIESVMDSNDQQIDITADLIQRTGHKSVAVLGLSFKPNTDDLRESPVVRLAEMLLGKGYDLRIYDEEVTLSHLTGTNRAYIDGVIPHLAALMHDSLAETVAGAQVIVVTRDTYPELPEIAHAGQLVIDLTRMLDTNAAEAVLV